MSKLAVALSLVNEADDTALQPRTLSNEEEDLLEKLSLVDAESVWFIERWCAGHNPELTFVELLLRETKEGARIKASLMKLQEELSVVDVDDSEKLFATWVKAAMEG